MALRQQTGGSSPGEQIQAARRAISPTPGEKVRAASNALNGSHASDHGFGIFSHLSTNRAVLSPFRNLIGQLRTPSPNKGLPEQPR